MSRFNITLITTRNDGCGLEVGKAEERFTNHERQEVTMKLGEMVWDASYKYINLHFF